MVVLDRIETLRDLDSAISADSMQDLREMAARNVELWIGMLPDGAWKGIEYEERQGKYVACYNFNQFQDDSDEALSGFITATVTQFNLKPEDLETEFQKNSGGDR